MNHFKIIILPFEPFFSFQNPIKKFGVRVNEKTVGRKMTSKKTFGK